MVGIPWALAFALRVESVWLLGGVFSLAGLYVAVQEALVEQVKDEAGETREDGSGEGPQAGRP